MIDQYSLENLVRTFKQHAEQVEKEQIERIEQCEYSLS